MEIRTTYKGVLNGIHGFWCGFKPDNLEVEEEIPVYYPDKGKVFVKNGVEYNSVVLQKGELISDYVEQMIK